MKQLTKFTINYFKPSGKWYSEGEFEIEATIIDGTDTVYMQDAVDFIESELLKNRSPDLNSNKDNFHIVLTSKNGYPVMLPICYCEKL